MADNDHYRTRTPQRFQRTCNPNGGGIMVGGLSQFYITIKLQKIN